MKPSPQAPASTGAASFGAAAFLLRVPFTVIARLDQVKPGKDKALGRAPYAIASASRRLSISDARSRNARARTGSSAVRRNSS
jgi:hypothetical protein